MITVCSMLFLDKYAPGTAKFQCEGLGLLPVHIEGQVIIPGLHSFSIEGELVAAAVLERKVDSFQTYPKSSVLFIDL